MQEFSVGLDDQDSKIIFSCRKQRMWPVVSGSKNKLVRYSFRVEELLCILKETINNSCQVSAYKGHIHRTEAAYFRISTLLSTVVRGRSIILLPQGRIKVQVVE